MYSILAEARAIAIEVKIASLPKANANLAAIVLYRDNITEVGRTSYPVGGGTVRIRDSVSDFNPHFYTFAVVNTAGNASSRSSRSNSLAARNVSVSDINARRNSTLLLKQMLLV